MEDLALGLERRADVADEQAGDEDGEEAGAVRHGRDAVDDARRRRACAACRGPGSGSENRCSHSAEQRARRATPIARPIDHLQRELAHDDPERRVRDASASSIMPDHQRDPDRVVRARLALEDRPRPPADLAVAEHREHHRRVGRRDRGAEQARDGPAAAEDAVRDERRSPPAVANVPTDAERGDRDGRAAEAPPADREPAVEEDHDQRDRRDALDGLRRDD